MQKNSSTRKPPSRVKYEKEHPTIAVRVSKELKRVLEDMREKTGLSFAQLIIKGLTESHEAYVEGLYDLGWIDGQEESAIWYNCWKCGKKCYITPNSSSHKALIRYMQEHRWGHTECP